jgi:hypothetical protein
MSEKFTMECGCNCHPAWICNWCAQHGHNLDGIIHDLGDMITDEEMKRELEEDPELYQ